MSRHEVIEELMAAYVLGSLSEEDSSEAEELLRAHVPDCSQCGRDIASWQDVASSMGLALDPVRPPKTLLPSIERDGRTLGARHRAVRNFFVAAGVAAALGLAGVAATQGINADSVGTRAADIETALRAASEAHARVVNLGPLRVISAPESGFVYIYGNDVAAPADGSTYRLWLASEGSYQYLGGLAVRDQSVFARVSISDLKKTALVVSVEDSGSAPLRPSRIAWQMGSN